MPKSITLRDAVAAQINTLGFAYTATPTLRAYRHEDEIGSGVHCDVSVRLHRPERLTVAQNAHVIQILVTMQQRISDEATGEALIGDCETISDALLGSEIDVDGVAFECVQTEDMPALDGKMLDGHGVFFWTVILTYADAWMGGDDKN